MRILRGEEKMHIQQFNQGVPPYVHQLKKLIIPLNKKMN